jgi:hypothetical protein
MKVKEALICPDCDEVFYAGNRLCPSCFNGEYLRLDKVLEEKAKVADGINLSTISSSINFNIIGESTIIIGDIKKTFKVRRQYLRVNYSNNTLEESGPMGDEVEYPKGWFICEEVIEEPKHCDGCHYLRPSEEEQANSKEYHKCTLHGYTLYHDGQHPKIPRPVACTKSYKKREA